VGGAIGRRIVVTTLGLLILAAPLSDSQETLSPEPGLERPPVVVVVFDELPLGSLENHRGRIDAKLFPHFARLAGDSTWFSNTVTGATFTQAAIPALLTGTYPERPVSDHYSNRYNLFTLLQDEYDIYAPEDLPGLCPEHVCSQPEDVVSPASDRFGRFASSERGSNFLAFREQFRAQEGPVLYFLHLVFPHSPWRYLPSGQDYPEVEPMPGETDPKGPGMGWSSDAWLVVKGLQRHLLQVQLADRVLGSLMSKLKKTDIYERSLIVVTADHGIAFEPNRPKRTVRDKTAEHLLPIPFLMKLPSQNEAVKLDHVVEIIDILPTIADAIDMAPTWGERWEGRSAFRARAAQFVEVDGVWFRAAGDPVNDLVDMKYRAFGESLGRLDLFEVGPGLAERLVGRSTSSLATQRSPGTWATITALDDLRTAAPEDPTVPALIQGSLNGFDAGPYTKVAISINDRIAAVTRTGSHRRPQFHALVDPRSLTEKGNHVEIYLIDSVEPARLTEIPVAD
jgi:Sulfatase